MDELLKKLADNARETVENLAKMLNTTADEVKRRIQKFEDDGLIKGYQAVINEEKVGLNRVTAVIEVKVVPEREGGFNRIASRIGRFPEVTDLYLMSGSMDLMLFVEGENLHKIASFVSEKLATIPGVSGTATHFMMKTYKRRGVLMTEETTDERLKVSP